ncbi:LuxR family transcriptional regulator [Knoellia sinensis KCTC 19936]|uniref:LuxR family transcriptional regulator n=1 Tax=Knoellia sinensis KCTC 19936 TaxID=1385520 RepID=A0A0A0J4K0_9MICO|nr:response regulator transcription factor [Knoellia sinensis]KGN31674.1 LuxR family transcriptional regulator [Knoellia sinensis KCTC 19936]
MTRVTVVEDHPLYRAAVVSLIDEMVDCQVVGCHSDAESALAAATDEQPDVVVLDLGLPGTDGITALSRFRAMDSPPAVLVLTMSEDPSVLAATLRAGAHGYVVKGSEPEDIARAVEAVAHGQVVFGAQVASAVLAQASGRAASGPAAAFPGLTHREHEVLELLARGRSNDDIAALLFLSPKTARNHVSSIVGKLAAGSRAELVAKARDAGFGSS